MIAGTETVLCLIVLAIGVVGLVAGFILTDRNAVLESRLPDHVEAEPVPAPLPTPAPPAVKQAKPGRK